MTKREVLDEIAYRLSKAHKLAETTPDRKKQYAAEARALDSLWIYLYYNLEPGNPGTKETE